MAAKSPFPEGRKTYYSQQLPFLRYFTNPEPWYQQIRREVTNIISKRCKHCTPHVVQSSPRAANSPSASTHGLWLTFHGDRSLPYTSDRSVSNMLSFCTRGISV